MKEGRLSGVCFLGTCFLPPRGLFMLLSRRELGGAEKGKTERLQEAKLHTVCFTVFQIYLPKSGWILTPPGSHLPWDSFLPKD